MEPLATDDYQLVRAAQEGDRAALGKLLQRHRGLALRLCRRLLNDDASAEDAVQEASLEALLHITRLRKPGQFGAWLAGIALNICRTWLRERAYETWSWEAMLGGHYIHLFPSQGASPEDVALESDLAHRVHAAVGQLPPSQREAITLFYLAGLTYQEMATALGIRLGAVKARLNKGRKALRAKLLKELEGIGLTTEQGAHPIAMRVVDVRRTNTTGEEKGRFCVLLQETDGERLLPIWIGTHEGTAIAMQLENVEVPRPHTYTFLANVLRAAGAQLIEARITRLDAEVFYAIAKIASTGGRLLDVDARPSDVINLAMLTGAPILVDPSVLRVAPQSERARASEPLTDENSAGAAVIAKEAKANWTSRTHK